MNKVYQRINWENYPSDATPLNERNLNKIDVATDEIDNRIISLDATKFDKSEAQLLVRYIEYDSDTGIFKITHYNGTSYTIDTLLDKLAINFDYDYQTQRLIIELSDGEFKYVDLSALITQYEFSDSNTVHFTISADGKVRAEIKEGSIQEKHLRPDYLADIKVEVAKAEADIAAFVFTAGTKADEAGEYATKAQSYAEGETGTRQGENTDNAKYYYNRSKEIYDDFLGVGNVTGVKGNAENSYRMGNVNLTPEDLGALSETGNTGNNTITFISNDVTDPAAWQSMALLTSGETHSSIFNKLSAAIKNVRYLYKMVGTTNISAIGGGTVTGAIHALASSAITTANIASQSVNYANTAGSATDPTKMPLSGGTFSGSITLANHTWNSAGDDCYFGDVNIGGCMAFKSKSNNALTGIAFYGRTSHNYDRILVADDGMDMYIATNGKLFVSNGTNNARAEIVASAFTQSSSRRAKKNIRSMTEEEAKKILQLSPVSFDYIKDEMPDGCYGLIAEDVKEIIPFCVTGNTDCSDDDSEAIDGIGIDYSKLVPYLIKMIQVQADEIAQLKRQFEEFGTGAGRKISAEN